MIFESISHVTSRGNVSSKTGFSSNHAFSFHRFHPLSPPAFDRKSEFSVRKAEGEAGGWKETEEV